MDDRFNYLVGYQSRLHRDGLAVPAWPEEFGGRGLGVEDVAAVATALGHGGAPELINFVGTEVVAPALLQFASPDELRVWLPAMASADELWCQMFSEPDAGSDLTNLRTRAERMPDRSWSVSGQKIWSTWAQHARWGVLLARTGSVEARHRGISAFVGDMTTPGIVVVARATRRRGPTRARGCSHQTADDRRRTTHHGSSRRSARAEARRLAGWIDRRCGGAVPLRGGRFHLRGNSANPAQHDRRAPPRVAQGALSMTQSPIPLHRYQVSVSSNRQSNAPHRSRAKPSARPCRPSP
jgi:hypothetical protein